jgi:Tol biopolymer transport system component
MQAGTQEPRGRSANLPDSQIRNQLERILASDVFTRSERLSSFLRFVVEQTLSGRTSGLKEQVLGAELYGKGPEFDGAADPIVRVDARRLRDKLREYYAEFPRDPVLISLPKGSYIPVFEDNESALPSVGPLQAVPPIQSVRRWQRPALVGAGLLVLIILALLLHNSSSRSKVIQVVRIPSFVDGKGFPSISPDGNLITFASSGTNGVGRGDIWIQDVKGEGLRRMTETPEIGENSPAWSPNGQEIAFVRQGQGIFTVQVAGGSEHRVSPSGTLVQWAPDGESVVIRDKEGDNPYALFQVFLHRVERRQLTHPHIGIGDVRFSVSPDGLNLAFIRAEHPGVADIFVVPMQGGEPRRITNWNSGQIESVTWTPDGKELIYSNPRLWRISATVQQPGRGTLVAGASEGGVGLSFSRPKRGEPARLAFLAATTTDTFRRLDLAAPLHDGVLQGATPFIAPVPSVCPGPFSADGTKFMFITGTPPLKLWSANVDGSNRREIISVNASQLSPGSWSPDGRRVVYDAAIDGNNDVFAVDSDGGNPKQLTREESLDGVATWSRDGHWIYYTSTRAGAVPDIWKMPADGGEPVRITYHGGIYAQEAPDGHYLYYADRPNEGKIGKSRLMRVPIGGGPEVEVLYGLTSFSWSVANSGIYFLVHEFDFDALAHYRYIDHRVTRKGRLPGRALFAKTSVSPDERWVLIPQRNRRSDLMLLENFR